MNPYEKELMQSSIEKIYGDFVSKVATGRKMNEETVDSIGQGRVWSGTSALAIGLIDEMGGLNEAISGAAKLADLESYLVRELPDLEDPYTRLLTQLSGELKMNILKNELGESVKFYNLIQEIKDMTGAQARLPYFIDIR
jgi:protease-4